MKQVKCIFLLLSVYFSLCVYAEDNYLKVWYKQPALEWVEALPIGNGRLGAMIFGGVKEELIQLNEETLWSGRPVDLNPNPEAVNYLPLVRKALFDEEWGKARDLCHKMQGDYTQSYLPLADLKIEYAFDDSSVESYRRELDIARAINKTIYTKNGIEYKREVFASAPEQLVLVKLSSSKKGALSFSASLSSL